MNIRIQAIHFDATDQLEAFIQKKGQSWNSISTALYRQKLV